MGRQVVKWVGEKRRKKKRGRGGKVVRGWAKSREREGEKSVWVFFFFQNILKLFKTSHKQ
jgi:hypothetical protein